MQERKDVSVPVPAQSAVYNVPIPTRILEDDGNSRLRHLSAIRQAGSHLKLHLHVALLVIDKLFIGSGAECYGEFPLCL